MKSMLFAILQEGRKSEYAAQRRVITNAIHVNPQRPVEVVRMSPAEGKAAPMLRTVVKSEPPQFKRSREAEFQLPVEDSASQSVYRIADESRVG